MEEYSVLGEEEESIHSFSGIQKNLYHAFDCGQKDYLEVFLRIKPITKENSEQDDQKYLDVESDQAVVVHPLKDPVVPPPPTAGAGLSFGARGRQHLGGGGAKFQPTSFQNNAQHHSLRFTFSRVFNEATDQKFFFDEAIQSTVREFLDGQNCLLFAYGVTNSGKTYTMQGTPADAGVVPRTFDVIFNSIGNRLYGRSDLKPSRFCDVESLDHEAESREISLKDSILRQIYVKTKKQISINFSTTSSDISKSISQMTADDSANKDVTGATNDEEEEISTIVANRRREQMQMAIRGSDRELFSIWASFAEVYNEQAYDLLVPPPEDAVRARRLRTTNGANSGASKAPSYQGRSTTNAGGYQRNVRLKTSSPPHFGRRERVSLPLKEDVHGRPYISGLREVNITSADEAFKLLTLGRRNLQMAYTKLNDSSSRSHCIFTLKLMRVLESSDGSEVRHSKFNILSLCDLAGIERSCKTHNIGERMKEAGNINNSLFTLGRCIQAIRHNQISQASDRQLLPPFRDSKLTRLFQSFLTGKGRAKMIVTVSQCRSMYPENLNAIRFSAIAKQVSLVPAQVFPIEIPKVLINPELQKHKLNPRDTIEWATASEIKKHKTVPFFGTGRMSVAEEGEEKDESNESTINEDESSDGSSDESQSEADISSITNDKLLTYVRKLEDENKSLKQVKMSLEGRIEKMGKETELHINSLHKKYEELLERAELRHEEAMDKKVELLTDAYEKALKRQRCDDDVETRESLASRMKDLEEELQISNQQLTNWKQNYDLMNREVQSLTREITEVKFQAAAERMQISGKSSSIEMENLELKAQLEKMREQNEYKEDCHKNKVKELEDKISQLEGMNRSLVSDLKAQNMFVSSSNAFVMELQSQNSELLMRIKHLEISLSRAVSNKSCSSVKPSALLGDTNTTNLHLSHNLDNMSLVEGASQNNENVKVSKTLETSNDEESAGSVKEEPKSNDYDSFESDKDLFSDSLNLVYSKKTLGGVTESCNGGLGDAFEDVDDDTSEDSRGDDATVDYQGDDSTSAVNKQRSLVELCLEPVEKAVHFDHSLAKSENVQLNPFHPDNKSGSVPYIDQSNSESSETESNDLTANTDHPIVTAEICKSSSKFSLPICPQKTPTMEPPSPLRLHHDPEQTTPEMYSKPVMAAETNDSKFVKPDEIVIASLYKSTRKPKLEGSVKSIRTSSRKAEGKVLEVPLITRSATRSGVRSSDDDDCDDFESISTSKKSLRPKARQTSKSRKESDEDLLFDTKENSWASKLTKKTRPMEPATTGRKKRNLFKLADDPILDVPCEEAPHTKKEASPSPLSSLKRHLRSRKM